MSIQTQISGWSDIVVSPTCSFRLALERINGGGYQIALVRDRSGKLLGVITDSDVRKAILRGVDLAERVTEVMNATPVVTSPSLTDEEAHQLMVLNHFFHIPIVNSEGMLVGLHVAQQLLSPKSLEEALVIMAGGRGRRLMPLTEATPKPMLPVNGRPMLEHIILRAKQEGFKKICISVNYLADQIINYFGDGSSNDVEITYIREDSPLGTAGALSLLPEEFRNKDLVITNGDILTDVSYLELLQHLKRHSSDGVMAVRMQEWQSPYGVVTTEGDTIIDIAEKPLYRHQVNAGIYALSPSLLGLLEDSAYCDMPDLFKKGKSRNLELRVFPLHESWIDIGKISDYEKANSSVN